jgi:hypothetical protein
MSVTASIARLLVSLFFDLARACGTSWRSRAYTLSYSA